MATSNYHLEREISLDEHTSTLFTTVGGGELIVCGDTVDGETLAGWAALAEAGSGPLILADHDVHAEINALANLLDDPEVHTALLLAHNGIDELNPVVLATPEFIATDGTPVGRSAGVLRVDAADRATFAGLARRAVTAADRSEQSAWQYAVELLVDGGVEIAVVPAAPFCASRGAMDLPSHSEPDRRLTAAAVTDQDIVTARVLRPLSRRVTKVAVAKGWSSQALTAVGTGTGLFAALIIGLGSRPAAILGAALLLAAGLLLLSDGELARYRRRRSVRGAWTNSVANRVVEFAVIAGVAVAGARLDEPVWILAMLAVGTLTVAETCAGSQRWHGLAVPTYRGARWLVLAVAIALASPAIALAVAACAGIAQTGAVLLARRRSGIAHDEFAAPNPVLQRRFLTPPGALIDAGVVVRALANSVGPRLSPWATRLLIAGFSLMVLAAGLSWRGNPWPIVLSSALLATAVAVGMAGGYGGGRGWWLPGALRTIEFVAVASIASSLVGAGQPWALLFAVCMSLVVLDGVDRNRLGIGAPPAFVALLGFGFDGRLLLLSALGTAAVAGSGLLAISVLLALVWLGLQSNWLRRTR